MTYNSAAHVITDVLPFKANKEYKANVTIPSQRIIILVDRVDTIIKKIIVIQKKTTKRSTVF